MSVGIAAGITAARTLTESLADYWAVASYEDLPPESKSGEQREVEIVANRYDGDGPEVIQCNVRDIT